MKTLTNLSLVVLAAAGAAALGASAAFAQTCTGAFCALAPIPGLTEVSSDVVNSTSLANFLNNLYIYLVGAAAILAIIEIMWGGLEIMTKDSVSKQRDGRERITNAILGLILVLSPVLVFSIINPAILNLSVNLPALDTKSTLSIPRSIPQDQNPNSLNNAPSVTPGSVTEIKKDGSDYKQCLAAARAKPPLCTIQSKEEILKTAQGERSITKYFCVCSSPAPTATP